MSYECPTKRNPKTNNHLLLGKRPTSPYKDVYSPHPQSCEKVPAPFRYTSDKAVPWNYTNHVVLQEPQAIRVSSEIKQDLSVNDIVGTGGMTRSGQYYPLGPRE